eukprot:1156458-Pelagomonas_calceolata.AAC.5
MSTQSRLTMLNPDEQDLDVRGLSKSCIPPNLCHTGLRADGRSHPNLEGVMDDGLLTISLLTK